MLLWILLVNNLLMVKEMNELTQELSQIILVALQIDDNLFHLRGYGKPKPIIEPKEICYLTQ